MDSSEPRNEKNSKTKRKINLRASLRGALGILIIFFVMIVVLLMVIPAATWTIKAVTGTISTADPFDMSIESVITYAISMLTLLVTVITLGVGFIAVLGYHQIKNDAHDTAIKIASDTSDEIMKKVETRVTDYLTNAENQRQSQEAERANFTNKYQDSIIKIISTSEHIPKKQQKRTSDERPKDSSTSIDDSAILNLQSNVDDVTDNELK